MIDRERYAHSVFGQRDQVLDQILRRSLLDSRRAPMQVSDECARTLQLLTCLQKPQVAIELGGFVGYSAIHIARGLPPGGRLTCVELDSELAEVTRKNVDILGLTDLVEVVCRDALNFLQSIPSESVDMVFIDADKRRYLQYLRESFRVLRRGGLLIADDACADGDYSSECIADPDGSEARSAIHSYNVSVARTKSLCSSLISSGHGLMVSIKAPRTAAALSTVDGSVEPIR